MLIYVRGIKLLYFQLGYIKQLGHKTYCLDIFWDLVYSEVISIREINALYFSTINSFYWNFMGFFSSPLSSFISQVKNFILLNFQIFKDHVCINPTVSWTVLPGLWKSCSKIRKQKSNNITVQNIKYFHILFFLHCHLPLKTNLREHQWEGRFHSSTHP